jgi:hypothetical protein
MILSMLTSVAFAACPPLDADLERATAAMIAGAFGAAREALGTAESSLGCAPASVDQIARFWLVTGALAHLEGDSVAAQRALAAARAGAPKGYDDRFGPKVKAIWETARNEGEGTLLIEPPLRASLDGARIETWPARVSASPHVLQVIADDGEVRFGRTFLIAPGEDALVDTGLTADALTARVSSTTETSGRAKKAPTFLIIAAAAAAGAGGCAAGAVLQTPQMEAAQDLSVLDAAHTRQQAFAYSTWGLAGVAALSVGAHFILP